MQKLVKPKRNKEIPYIDHFIIYHQGKQADGLKVDFVLASVASQVCSKYYMQAMKIWEDLMG